MADALSAAETWQSHHAQEMKDKSRLEVEVTQLNRFVAPDIDMRMSSDLQLVTCAGDAAKTRSGLENSVARVVNNNNIKQKMKM